MSDQAQMSKYEGLAADMGEDAHYLFEERAGIFEYDAGMDREEAEKKAFDWLMSDEGKKFLPEKESVSG